MQSAILSEENPLREPASEAVLHSAAISPAEIRLLSAIGFMAARAGHLLASLRIFEALSIHRPKSAFPFIGMTTAYLAVGMHAEAIHMLRERGLRSCGEQHDLRLWLALALQQSGNSRWAAREFGKWMEAAGPDRPVNHLAKLLGDSLGIGPAKQDWPIPASVVE